MARKSEREIVGEGLSDEEYAALNGDGGSDQIEMTPEPDAGASQGDPSPQTTEPAAAAPIATQGDPEPKMVDIRALQEARSELRRRDEELARFKAEKEAEFARLDERMKLINEALQPKPAAPKVPTMEEEPLEHIDHRFKTVEERLEAMQKADEERRKQVEYETSRQMLLSEVDVVLNNAGTKHADVPEALNFAADGLRKEIHRVLQAQNTPAHVYQAKANQMFQNELTRLAQACPRNPDDAAEFVRRNARYWGWTGPQVAPQVQEQAVAQPQTQQPTIQQRQEQQQRHMSLSGVPGAEPPKKLDAKAITALSDKEFNALLKTVEGRKILEEEFGGF